MTMRTPASLVLAALALAAAPSAASADGVDIGQKVRGPGNACQGNSVGNDSVKVCFQPDGEYLYVKDKDADGRSAYGDMMSGYDDCRNPYGKGTWVRCNYAFREGTPVGFRGFTKDNEGRINWTRDETEWTQDLA